MSEKERLQQFEAAKADYARLGVDVEQAIKRADAIPISMHCWQGDDLIGFDGASSLSGGIQATGNYPGRARNVGELRRDIEFALSLIPGTMKVNLHSSYAENTAGLDRDGYTFEQFRGWVEWAAQRGLGLDFNPTFFSHRHMEGNFTLSALDTGKRRFWIEHGKRCREIGQAIGKTLGKPCVVNFWMPDGYKDIPADTNLRRLLMTEALDEIFSAEMNSSLMLDAIESKLFGLGAESYTVVNHEYAFGYALTRGKVYTLDAGHFHPTESIAAKFTACLQFMQHLMLHISRGVRWDSDHIVVWNDELQDTMNEILHNHFDKRVFVGLDYFDASVNRAAAWVIGVRNARKALLKAALSPLEASRQAEREGNYTRRLALLEESKSLPFSAVWDTYCSSCGVPGHSWINEVERYEKDVLALRDH